MPSGRVLRMHAQESNWIAQNLHQDGLDGYEPETLAVFLPLARQARTMIDVGAHIGTLALIAAVENPALRVFAFEPAPAIFARLQANIGANRRANVIAIQAAASDCDGTTQLYVPAGDIPTESSLYSGFRAGSAAVEVQTIRLDTFVEKQEIPNVDLMKIDAELYEAAVIAGAINLIRRDLPIIICEVLADVDADQIHRQLDPLSYRYYWITGQGLVALEHLEGDRTYHDLNFLFVPKSKLHVLEDSVLPFAKTAH